MDEIESLRQYAKSLDTAAIPPMDVTANVLATIRRRRARPDWFATAERPLLMAAAASLFLAATLGVMAQQSIAKLQDPMVSLFTPLTVTLQ